MRTLVLVGYSAPGRKGAYEMFKNISTFFAAAALGLSGVVMVAAQTEAGQMLSYVLVACSLLTVGMATVSELDELDQRKSGSKGLLDWLW